MHRTGFTNTLANLRARPLGAEARINCALNGTAEQTAEKVNSHISAAKAVVERKALNAALKGQDYFRIADYSFRMSEMVVAWRRRV